MRFRAIACAGTACLTVLLAGCHPHTSGAGTTTGARGAAKGPWTMPNLVGSQLQRAQNAVQKLTGNPLFRTRSHDATGRKRRQVIDSNWKVCTQNVPAGKKFTRDTVIDFGAVKNSEKCR